MALVFLTLIVATNILTEAALSFLGVGVLLLLAATSSSRKDDTIATAPGLQLRPGSPS